MKKALILLSGGMDSAVCLYEAAAAHGRKAVCALFFDWGQRTIVEERAACAGLCLAAGIDPPVEVRLDFPYTGLLTDTDTAVPSGRTPEEIKREGVAPTFFPGRNMVMLSYAFGMAAHQSIGHVYFGPNAEDEAGYPDCRREFVIRFAEAGRAGTDSEIQLASPLLEMSKEEIVKRGDALGVPWDLTFSCYSPIDGAHCGSCDACMLRKRAFIGARRSADPHLLPPDPV